MKQWLLQILIALDQLGNALLKGWADETLSSRSYRWNRDKHALRFLRPLIDGLFFWQENHCHRAYLSEKQRKHLAPEFR